MTVKFSDLYDDEDRAMLDDLLEARSEMVRDAATDPLGVVAMNLAKLYSEGGEAIKEVGQSLLLGAAMNAYADPQELARRNKGLHVLAITLDNTVAILAAAAERFHSASRGETDR